LNERLVVFDTNVVLDMLHFDDPLARPLRRALECGGLRGAATQASFGEWARVLAYPAFALDAARQAEQAGRYRAACAFFDAPAIAGVPRCADADDQKFLDLAAALRVPLISKDRAVLALRRRCASLFPILTPAGAADWLAGR
jgi:predicted nucleic acid-binding protein